MESREWKDREERVRDRGEGKREEGKVRVREERVRKKGREERGPYCLWDAAPKKSFPRP